MGLILAPFRKKGERSLISIASIEPNVKFKVCTKPIMLIVLFTTVGTTGFVLDRNNWEGKSYEWSI